MTVETKGARPDRLASSAGPNAPASLEVIRSTPTFSAAHDNGTQIVDRIPGLITRF